jgi:acyl carrier protein
VSIYKRLITFFEEQELNYIKTLRPNESLIKSGIINSLVLFNLALWVEQEVGSPIDFADINLPDDWDTIEKVVLFIERCSSINGSPAKN